jgi:hypothetical protein
LTSATTRDAQDGRKSPTTKPGVCGEISERQQVDASSIVDTMNVRKTLFLIFSRGLGLYSALHSQWQGEQYEF